MYHSEFGQDKYLDETIFKGKRDGVFFECGALDGEMDSNTLFFEKERGWTGLLVEAHPENAEICRAKRTATVVHGALNDREGHADFLACVGGLTGWSGMPDRFEREHADRVIEKIKSEQRTVVTVPCFRLQTVLGAHGITRIDYATLDIEGAEYQVLQAFDWSVPIDVFEIEDNFGNFPIDQFMGKRGYMKIARMGVSSIFKLY
jgi:FkbM family methyltransferase